MKVLHIISSLSVGGAERALYNLLNGGLAKELDCHVLSLRDEGGYGPRIRALGVPVQALDLKNFKGLVQAGYRLKQIVSKTRPEIIQGWMYHGNMAASIACMLSSHNPVETWNIRHSLYDITDEKKLTRYVIRFNRLLSLRAKAIIYNSHLSKDQHEDFGFAKKSGMVIPNGFDLSELVEKPATASRLRETLGIGVNDQIIGHVARFHPMKDHATFLRSAVKVAMRLPAVYFILIGRDVHLANPALSGIVPRELENRFRFLGERSDVYDLMQTFDIFCSSSWSEGFPNVLGEAMAMGIPCIATDVGDSARVVFDTGSVVPPREVEVMVKAMLDMLMIPSDERNALGQKARQRIEKNYALTEMVSHYARLYENLVVEAQ